MRCFREDLGFTPRRLNHPLHKLTHPLITKAHELVPDSAQWGPVKDLPDMYIKVKRKRPGWRGAALNEPDAFWLVGAGVRRQQPDDAPYPYLRRLFDHGQLIVLDRDRDRLQAETAIRVKDAIRPQLESLIRGVVAAPGEPKEGTIDFLGPVTMLVEDDDDVEYVWFACHVETARELGATDALLFLVVALAQELLGCDLDDQYTERDVPESLRHLDGGVLLVGMRPR